MATFSPTRRNRPLITLPNKSAVIEELTNMAYLMLGILLAVAAYVIFQIPHNVSWGGMSGAAIIVNHLTGLSHGTAYWILCSPTIVLGFFTMGRWKFVAKAIFIVLVYSALTDMAVAFADGQVFVEDRFLSIIYSGILGGIGGGLIFRSKSAFPGTSVISKLINERTGLPLSSIYIFIDGSVIIAMGAIFGMESALYGFLMLFISGIATDYVMEGPSTTRTATIVTDNPVAVSNMLMSTLNRGVSYWEITGAHTGQTRYMVMTTIARSQMSHVSKAVKSADANAFLTIGVSHKAYGFGFSPLR